MQSGLFIIWFLSQTSIYMMFD